MEALNAEWQRGSTRKRAFGRADPRSTPGACSRLQRAGARRPVRLGRITLAWVEMTDNHRPYITPSRNCAARKTVSSLRASPPLLLSLSLSKTHT